ncbi:S9 family peptidase [bacterium]|nr:S9 family peptidase [bacterium]
MVASKRLVRAEDLYQIELITNFDLSPDGRHVIYSVQRIDPKKQKKYANLWVVSTQGGQARQFTYGDQVDRAPRWSPDGNTIAFLSNRKDERQFQIYLLPFNGGEARMLTSLVGAIGSYEWSPDGRSFVSMVLKRDKDALQREKDELKKQLGVVSRHIKRVIFKFDETGNYITEERWHIWTIDARSGRAIQLTDGYEYDEVSPCWTKDGQHIAFVSNRSKDPDFELEAMDLYTISRRGGEMTKITTTIGYKMSPSCSPDGKWLAYYTQEGTMEPWRNNDLCVVPLDGNGPVINLTRSCNRTVSASVINDVTGYPVETPPTWSKDSSTLFFTIGWQGTVSLHSIRLDQPETSLNSILEFPGFVGKFLFDRDQKKIVYYRGDQTDPGQLWLHDLKKQTTHALTAVNRKYLSSVQLGLYEAVCFEGPGNYFLQGWILKPPGFDPARKYPSILEIHGGPRTQYGYAFMHEFHFLAAQGFVIYFCNPRGGKGYGEDHARSIWNNWGTIDYEDLMACADFMAAQPYIDPKRMGVTGGSYGGYMTNMIIGRTQRFKAAVTQRSVCNLISMYGTSDYNWSFQKEFGHCPPWENLENYWRQSPLKNIANARTPTLVIHSEKDYRASVEQGEQIFVALKKVGVETELVLFPEEAHGLSRDGRTDRRIERLNHILRWFKTYL